MDPLRAATAADPERYFAELGAFDYFYDYMRLQVSPSLVQGQFIKERLVSADGIGGMAIFLPDHAKMEEMLKQVKGSIVLNGPISFGKLCRVFNSIPLYQKLATDLNSKSMVYTELAGYPCVLEKQMELKNKAFSDKNIASSAGM